MFWEFMSAVMNVFSREMIVFLVIYSQTSLIRYPLICLSQDPASNVRGPIYYIKILPINPFVSASGSGQSKWAQNPKNTLHLSPFNPVLHYQWALHFGCLFRHCDSILYPLFIFVMRRIINGKWPQTTKNTLLQ